MGRVQVKTLYFFRSLEAVAVSAKKMYEIADIILKGQDISGDEALALAQTLSSQSLGMTLDIMGLSRLTRLLAEGDGKAEPDIKKTSGGQAPFTCGIINAKSGRCSEDCSFCAQSRHYQTGTVAYSLVEAETLLERAHFLAAVGADYFGVVLSGGEPSKRDFEKICETTVDIIRATGLKLCASLGLLNQEQALALRQAGFTSYHHNLETAPSFYPRICTTHQMEHRVETVKNAKRAGLRVCSGGIFGLGENWAQRVEMAEILRELEVDSIPINFLIPIFGTPLADASVLSPREALLIIALFRLMHPCRDLVVCGGRGRVLGEWDRLVFSAGANGIMIGDYLTTKGKTPERDLEILNELGLRQAKSSGSVAGK